MKLITKISLLSTTAVLLSSPLVMAGPPRSYPSTVNAQSAGNGALTGSSKAASGEVGYKIGCVLAAEAKVPSCGEYPSGRQFLPQPQHSSSSTSTSSTAGVGN